jgi:hypothetical protein
MRSDQQQDPDEPEFMVCMGKGPCADEPLFGWSVVDGQAAPALRRLDAVANAGQKAADASVNVRLQQQAVGGLRRPGWSLGAWP